MSESERTLIDGSPVKMGGREYIIPALSLGQVKRLRKDLSKTETKKNPEDLTDKEKDEMAEATIRIIHAAVKRNYPDLKLEDLEDMVDLNNMLPIVLAIKGQSGFVTATSTGTDTDAGEK